MIFLCVNLHDFILLAICWFSWVCYLMFLFNFKSFQTLLFIFFFHLYTYSSISSSEALIGMVDSVAQICSWNLLTNILIIVFFNSRIFILNYTFLPLYWYSWWDFLLIVAILSFNSLDVIFFSFECIYNNLFKIFVY